MVANGNSMVIYHHLLGENQIYHHLESCQGFIWILLVFIHDFFIISGSFCWMNIHHLHAMKMPADVVGAQAHFRVQQLKGPRFCAGLRLQDH